MENNYTVYKHTTPDSKVYIGITGNDVEVRWGNGFGYQAQDFFKAIVKHGWDNIKHEILATQLTKKEAEQMERDLIKEYKSTNRLYGWNAMESYGEHLPLANAIRQINIEKRKQEKEKLVMKNLGELVGKQFIGVSGKKEIAQIVGLKNKKRTLVTSVNSMNGYLEENNIPYRIEQKRKTIKGIKETIYYVVESDTLSVTRGKIIQKIMRLKRKIDLKQEMLEKYGIELDWKLKRIS